MKNPEIRAKQADKTLTCGRLFSANLTPHGTVVKISKRSLFPTCATLHITNGSYSILVLPLLYKQNRGSMYVQNTSNDALPEQRAISASRKRRIISRNHFSRKMLFCLSIFMKQNCTTEYSFTLARLLYLPLVDILDRYKISYLSDSVHCYYIA